MKKISKTKKIQWIIEEFLEKYADYEIKLPKNNKDDSILLSEIKKNARILLPKDEKDARILLGEIEKNLFVDETKSKQAIVKDVQYEYKGRKSAILFGALETTPNEAKQVDFVLEVNKWHTELNAIWKNIKDRIQFDRMNLPLPKAILSFDSKINIDEERLDFKRELAFLNLLNDVPFNCFRKCAYEICNRWFFTTREKRQYCSESCARIIRQKKHKEKDPEAYREYCRTKQNKYYRKIHGLPVTKFSQKGGKP